MTLMAGSSRRNWLRPTRASAGPGRGAALPRRKVLPRARSVGCVRASSAVVGPVDLLKVGHHGSASATSDEWLDELAPHDAVISVGRRNTYGHPTPDVLERLARHGVAIFRTDRNGTITFSTDGHGARLRSHHD